MTQEVIDQFEEEHPDITINAEYGGFDDQWDQLATQTAGGNAPDIIQMDEKYLREYADRGTLLELNAVDVDQHEETAVENGTVDGALYAATMGMNAQVLIADPQLFEQAGVEMPDDETWTWDDFSQITADLTEGLDDGWGTAGPRGIGAFQTWIRQSGGNVVTEDGELGFEVDAAAGYFEYFSELLDQGVLPPAEVIQENTSAPMEESLPATGREAISTWWTNESVALTEAAGHKMEILRYPSRTGNPEDAEPWYKSSMYLSASAGTEYPEAAQAFIDYFVNSRAAADITGVERGIPSNPQVREHVQQDLEAMEADTVEYIDAIESDLGDPEPLTAPGASNFNDILGRYQMEVFFGRMNPDEAAQSMYGEMEAQLS
ncbi:ABC transporter substrate-binding protein [Nesterenkonia sp. F]|uniref:ABC transporter substrate-binding protein n=1 Tax=Nesterenkonia sp. F TaxID=795955 RepID=UPI000255D787|nr:extracellular solute-binding protein [Nesterenkonia sp. F]